MKLLVGLDLGGSKSAVLAETPEGDVVVDAVLPAEGWDAEPVEHGVSWVQALLARTLPADADVVALGIGAQGLDSPETVAAFSRGLQDAGRSAVCVNDAALLVPAAGFAQGIGLIAGTGAIGVGTDADGRPLITGGWGWVIGDEAGAAGLVREATKAALLAHDDGVADDGLLSALQEAFDVDSAERLARRVNDDPTMANWAPAAPAVFAAADAGSMLAERIIDEGAAHLARLVDQLVRRGAVGTDVVCAGGVIAHQPRLLDAVRVAVVARHPQFHVHLLSRPPVFGALALARTLITADTKE